MPSDEVAKFIRTTTHPPLHFPAENLFFPASEQKMLLELLRVLKFSVSPKKLFQFAIVQIFSRRSEYAENLQFLCLADSARPGTNKETKIVCPAGHIGQAAM